MTSRAAYTLSDELKMWKFCVKKAGENKNSIHFKGLQLWREYCAEVDDSRSPDALTSHYRKKMLPRIHLSPLSVEEIFMLHWRGAPLDMTKFSRLCKTMGKAEFYKVCVKRKEARAMLNESNSPINETKPRVVTRRKVMDDSDEINSVINECKNKPKLQKKPKLEEPESSHISDSDNDSGDSDASMCVNVHRENLSTEDCPETCEPAKMSESMREELNDENNLPTGSQSEETLQDGQGFHIRHGEEEENVQHVPIENTESEEDPNPHITISQIKEDMIQKICAEVDTKLGIFISLNVLIRKEIFYISAGVTCRKDLIDELDKFYQGFVKYIQEEIDLKPFFLQIEKKDMITFDRKKFENVREVKNSKISEEERAKYYKKAHCHLRKSPFSKLFRVQHRLQCIEAVAASFSSLKENYYYSIMEELFKEIGIPV